MKALGKDPCNHSIEEHMALVTCFIESVIQGVSIKNKDSIRSATVKGYADQINELHKLRGFQPPIFNHRDNAPFILYKALKEEEHIAKQRKPLTEEMVSEIIRLGDNASPESKEACIRDIVKILRLIGPRAAEIVQKTQSKADVHIYPSGNKVIKALCPNRIKGYDNRGRLVLNPVKNRAAVEKVAVEWAIQKNRKNGEIKWYSRDHLNPEMCMVDAMLNLLERAESLLQADDLPFCVYRNNRGKTVYLTAQELTKYIRKVAKKLYPHMTEEELSYFSCHSLRVWAAVLLSEAGKDGDYIKIRLRWCSESYRVYLRDTLNSAIEHNRSLNTNSRNILYALNQSLLDDIDEEFDEIDAEEMGDYIDLE
jgi:hypothetical protein